MQLLNIFYTGKFVILPLSRVRKDGWAWRGWVQAAEQDRTVSHTD